LSQPGATIGEYQATPRAFDEIFADLRPQIAELMADSAAGYHEFFGRFRDGAMTKHAFEYLKRSDIALHQGFPRRLALSIAAWARQAAVAQPVSHSEFRLDEVGWIAERVDG